MGGGTDPLSSREPTFLSVWLSKISLSVRANTGGIYCVVPIEMWGFFLELLRGAEQVIPCGGALGARLGACVGLFVGLDWAGTMVWLAVIGVLQIRERFDVGL